MKMQAARMADEGSMLRAVGVAIAGPVRAWPEYVTDETVRAIRDAGYVRPVRVFRGVAMAQVEFGAWRIEDELTDAGARFLLHDEGGRS